jgi:hypothetical protein
MVYAWIVKAVLVGFIHIMIDQYWANTLRHAVSCGRKENCLLASSNSTRIEETMVTVKFY